MNIIMLKINLKSDVDIDFADYNILFYTLTDGLSNQPSHSPTQIGSGENTQQHKIKKRDGEQ